MSHYEERMQRDLDAILARVADLGARVETAARAAVHALLHRDRQKAAETILQDHPVNRGTREVDRLCHVFVARHLPSAGVLRTISSVLRMSVAIERVGDYAVTIARETVQLDADVPEPIKRDIELVAESSLTLFAQAMRAFNEQNPELARGTKGQGSRPRRRTSHRVFHDLVRVGEDQAPPLADLFALLMCIQRLERIGSQALNICEETIFATTGEVKQPKVYNVLFVDRANDGASIMAEAIARRTFPHSGRYTSAGWQPSTKVLPAVRAFLDRTGHDVGGLAPTPFDATYGELENVHVVVSLDGDALARIPELPFHTTVLTWQVSPSTTAAQDMQAEEWLQALFRDLSGRIQDLMRTLRGEKAD